ncbi:MAG: HAMP domain-containing protein [Proteobacteria bacterium]|nr:HAMP domain-containing protein [Pseudomonadota bacterium]
MTDPTGTNMRFDLSLPTKITILIVLALVITGAALVFLGSSLIIKDKTSYIYDYTASQADLVAKNLNSVLEPISKLALTAEATGNREISKSLRALKDLFNIQAEELPRTPPEPQYIDLIRSTHHLGVDIVLHLSNGRVFKMFSAENAVNEQQVAGDFNLCVISPATKRVLFGIERIPFQKDGSCKEVAQRVNPGFEQGTQEIELNHKEYLLGYRAIMGGNILVLSLVSRKLAFESARSLLERSGILGLALLFFALGIALIFLKAITKRIDDLTLASLEISKGNLDISLVESRSVRDELSVLSNTFLIMSRKIKDLLKESASKARMEKELEAAELVQKQFFPSTMFRDARIAIEGLSRSASECGGDIWQFRKIGKRIYFVFGDVTGHGVPAALITASIFGAFTAAMDSFEFESQSPAPPETALQKLSRILNSSILKAAKGETWFSCMVGIVDLEQDSLLYQNFAHPRPFFWENKEASPEGLESFPGAPLGSPEIDFAKIFHRPFKSDSRIVFYSDGLFDKRTQDSKSLRKREILSQLHAAFQSRLEIEQVLNQLMDEMTRFFGTTPPDDVTVVIIDRR